MLDQPWIGVTWDRFAAIKRQMLAEPVRLCPERALLLGRFRRRGGCGDLPPVLARAQAFAYLMRRKPPRIHDHELIVGAVGSFRRSVLVHPEFDARARAQCLACGGDGRQAPLPLTLAARLGVLVGQCGRRPARGRDLPPAQALWFDEADDGRFLPDFASFLRLGVDGLLASISGREGPFFEAARLVGQALTAHATRLAEEAERLARSSHEARAAELRQIARVCRKTPARPAETFHEALQALWLCYMGLELESPGLVSSLGRVDQYLYPYYVADLIAGRINAAQARELLLCLMAKAAEVTRWWPSRLGDDEAPRPQALALVLGGDDGAGGDGANELSRLIIEAAAQAGLGSASLQIRLHAGASPRFLRWALEAAWRGGLSVSLACDEAVIASLTERGRGAAEAAGYALDARGGVAVPGVSFVWPGAACFNLPLCLELALNQGRCFGSKRRLGLATPPPAGMGGLGQVLDAFGRQMDFLLGRAVEGLRAARHGRRRWWAAPLASLLSDGCRQRGLDLAGGGARCDHGAIQGVGLADTADSLAALQTVVFENRQASLSQLTAEMAAGFSKNFKLLGAILAAPKLGGGHPLPTAMARRVSGLFHECLSRRGQGEDAFWPGMNSGEGGRTLGLRTGALPNGRLAGQPLTPGLSPAGEGGRGPLAALRAAMAVDNRALGDGGAVDIVLDLARGGGDDELEMLCRLAREHCLGGGMGLRLLAPPASSRARS